MTEGWIILLHKKGAKDSLANYDVVCFLPLINRVLGRIFVGRPRKWTEEIGAIDENQAVLRRGRFTADVTQTISRLKGETSRVVGFSVEDNGERSAVVILHVTEAYPWGEPSDSMVNSAET